MVVVVGRERADLCVTEGEQRWWSNARLQRLSVRDERCRAGDWGASTWSPWWAGGCAEARGEVKGVCGGAVANKAFLGGRGAGLLTAWAGGTLWGRCKGHWHCSGA